MLSLLWAGSPAPICGPAALSCPGCASESRLPVPKGGRPGGGVGTWLGDPGAIGGDLGVILSHSLSFAFSCFLSGSDVNPSSTPPFSTGLGGPSPAFEKHHKPSGSPGESHLALCQPSQGQTLGGDISMPKCAEPARTGLFSGLPAAPVTNHPTRPLGVPA